MIIKLYKCVECDEVWEKDTDALMCCGRGDMISEVHECDNCGYVFKEGKPSNETCFICGVGSGDGSTTIPKKPEPPKV